MTMNSPAKLIPVAIAARTDLEVEGTIHSIFLCSSVATFSVGSQLVQQNSWFKKKMAV
jgi:hypothetical protein